MAKPFRGVIKLDVRDSKPDWAPYTLKKAPAGGVSVLGLESSSQGSLMERIGSLEYAERRLRIR